jgi:hypothetical protein
VNDRQATSNQPQPDLELTETEERIVRWMRSATGVAQLQAITERQRHALVGFLETMRESPTVH